MRLESELMQQQSDSNSKEQFCKSPDLATMSTQTLNQPAQLGGVV